MDSFDFTRPEATLQLIGFPRQVTRAEFDDLNPSELTTPANSPEPDLTLGPFPEMIDCVHGLSHARPSFRH